MKAYYENSSKVSIDTYLFFLEAQFFLQHIERFLVLHITDLLRKK